MPAYTVAPLDDMSWVGQQGTEATRFSAKLGATEDLLVAEVAALKGTGLTLQLDIAPHDLRLDGTLRANARTPGRPVVVSFDSPHGPLTYRCDRFVASYAYQGPDWWHNLRGIALTLQALRAITRYGSLAGEQYVGSRALPAGRAMPSSHMTNDDALAVLRGAVGDGWEDMNSIELCRKARIAAHPDRHGGDHTLAYEVDHAATILGRP